MKTQRGQAVVEAVFAVLIFVSFTAAVYRLSFAFLQSELDERNAFDVELSKM